MRLQMTPPTVIAAFEPYRCWKTAPGACLSAGRGAAVFAITASMSNLVVGAPPKKRSYSLIGEARQALPGSDIPSLSAAPV